MINLRIILPCLLFLLIGGCAHHKRNHDGPPQFYVDESKIPNATPRAERLSKYGNMPSYVVFGKRYYTMKNSRNYEATGIASWYGTSFHARNTSSGEPYNMLAMTAAHKSLPLPTYVEVTNLRNQRKVIVKVNDRGPFVSDRLIDLSYVAAKKLGMLGHGTTHVKIRAINPSDFGRQIEFAKKRPLVPASSPMTFANAQKSAVYLQVGAFKERQHAEHLRSRLVALLSQPINISQNNQLYKVRIGPFRDLATADSISQELQGLGISSNKIQ